jgi:hypothetical protein
VQSQLGQRDSPGDRKREMNEDEARDQSNRVQVRDSFDCERFRPSIVNDQCVGTVLTMDDVRSKLEAAGVPRRCKILWKSH